MARHWTIEERQRQAALIRNWRPWEQSTGPKTPEGKAAASENARKHGLRSAEWIENEKRFKELLRRCGQLLEGLS
jgi:hypothetical protein